MRTIVILAASMIALGASGLAAGASSKAIDREAKPFDKEVAAEAHGEGVERVDVTSEPGRTLIKVVLPEHSSRNGDATLHIQIPKDSELHLTTVSADAKVSGVQGAQRVNVVSGDVSTEIAGADLDLKTVSGDVKIKGHGQS